MKLFIILLSTFFGTIFLQNCSLVTYAASGKIEQFTGKYELPFKETKEKSIADLKNILIKMGFKNDSNYDLNFSKKSNAIEGLGLTSIYENNLSLTFDNNNMMILTILQSGNYKYGTEAKTNETFEKIKQQYNNQK